jgi:hypothetical protein
MPKEEDVFILERAFFIKYRGQQITVSFGVGIKDGGFYHPEKTSSCFFRSKIE